MQSNQFQDDLRHQYDRLWSASVGRIRAGEVELDKVLATQAPDQRRGLTLIARPSPDVRFRVATFLRRLRKLEPDQHYYTSAGLHLTILSLFTATREYGPFLAKINSYISAVDAVLRNVPPFRVSFVGVTASPGTVMLQGFFDSNLLPGLREALRSSLAEHGLVEGLDKRYKLITAHMTVMRFRAPLRDSGLFAAALESRRDQVFGRCEIKSLSVVENDWYMTPDATRVLKRYRLNG